MGEQAIERAEAFAARMRGDRPPRSADPTREMFKQRDAIGMVYMRYFVRVNRKVRPGVIGVAQFLNRCVTHWHFYKFTRDTRAGLANSDVMAAGMNG